MSFTLCITPHEPDALALGCSLSCTSLACSEPGDDASDEARDAALPCRPLRVSESASSPSLLSRRSSG